MERTVSIELTTLSLEDSRSTISSYIRKIQSSRTASTGAALLQIVKDHAHRLVHQQRDGYWQFKKEKDPESCDFRASWVRD